MDIRDMEVFLKIAEYESVSRAAQDLHIAQPHLTRQLKALEKELGTELLTREKNRLHITEEGLYLKQQCRQILNLKEKTEEQLTQIHSGYSGKVYIGAIETAGSVYLPRWISGFRKMYPSISYYLWTANSVDVIERLKNGTIDIALIRCDYDRSSFEGIHIRTEPWVAVLSKDDPLAKKEGPLSFSELAGYPLIVPISRAAEVRTWFAEENLSSDIMCEFSPLMNAIVLTENNLGAAILPESALEYFSGRNIVQKQLEREKTTELNLIWKADVKLSKPAARFVEYVSQQMMERKTAW